MLLLAAISTFVPVALFVPLVLAQQESPDSEQDPSNLHAGILYIDPDGNGAVSPYTQEEAIAEGFLVKVDPMEMFDKQDPPRHKTERWIGDAGLPVEVDHHGDRRIVTQEDGDQRFVINCDVTFWTIEKDSHLQPGQYQRVKDDAERCIENGVHPPDANPGVRKLLDEMTIEERS